MHTPRVLSRELVYKLLREALYAYAEQLDVLGVKLFALEMEIIPGTSDSEDPALLHVFNKTFPPIVSAPEAFALAAEYVDDELVTLRHIEAARVIVDQLRRASRQPDLADPNLQAWMTSA